jgi:hypothetical protein
MIPTSIRPLVTSLVLAACSSSTASDAPASTTPSQASAALTSAAPNMAETPKPSATAAVLPTSASIKTPDYEGVVLAVKSVGQTGMTSVGKAQLDGTWVPNAGDVAAFESGLAAHMTKSVPPASKDLPSKLKSYKRQWFGVTAGTRKLIFGNFFCRETSGWEEGVIMVDDGGDCYFQVFYDVTSREYLGLMINGNA